MADQNLLLLNALVFGTEEKLSDVICDNDYHETILTFVLHAYIEQFQNIDLDKVEILLQEGASVLWWQEDVDDVDESWERRGSNAITIAYRKKTLPFKHKMDIVDMLLDYAYYAKENLKDVLNSYSLYAGNVLNFAIHEANEEIALQTFELYNEWHIEHEDPEEPAILQRIAMHESYSEWGYLATAGERGMPRLAKLLMSMVGKENEQVVIDFTLRHAAKHENNMEWIRELVQMGGDVNAKTAMTVGNEDLPYDSYSALRNAIEYNNLAIVKMLVNELNADICITYTLLCDAITTKNIKLVTFLIDKGLPPNQTVTFKGWDYISHFLLAIRYDALDVAKKLKDLGADVTQKIENLVPALHTSVAQRGSECLPYLLTLESVAADLETRCNKIGTPLTIACRFAHFKEAEYLLKFGADPDNMGEPTYFFRVTPLGCAIQSFLTASVDDAVLTVLRLLQYGVDVDFDLMPNWTEDELSVTISPFKLAIGYRILPIAYMLWEAGCQPPKDVMWLDVKKKVCPKKKVLSFLADIKLNPRSLQSLARLSVRKFIGPRNVKKALNELDVSQTARSYLDFSDLVDVMNTMIPEYKEMREEWLLRTQNESDPKDDDHDDSDKPYPDNSDVWQFGIIHDMVYS